MTEPNQKKSFVDFGALPQSRVHFQWTKNSLTQKFGPRLAADPGNDLSEHK
jgi:hypothetical protein